MIAFLKGTMAGRSADTAFVDVNGVGFAVYMPATDIVKLPEAGADVALFTHLAVREDAMTLYGFLSQEEHALFLRLIGVSGIGPKAALAALSTFKPAELISAIQSDGQFGAGGRARPVQRRDGSRHRTLAGRARRSACYGLHAGRGRFGAEGCSRRIEYRGCAVAVCFKATWLGGVKEVIRG